MCQELTSFTVIQMNFVFQAFKTINIKHPILYYQEIRAATQITASSNN